MANPKKDIVLDIGGDTCKIGFSGEDEPQHIIPTVFGKKNVDNNGSLETFIGNDALKKRSMLTLNYPMKGGCVTNWDEMENIWQHAFTDKMGVSAKNHRVLLTEAPLNPAENKEKMTEIIFEKFGVPAMFVAVQGVLSLYASGRFTGVVLESGDSVTQIIPIENGYAKANAIERVNFAGANLNDYLKKILPETSRIDDDIVRKYKETSCYVALDYDKEIAANSTDNISFTCPEALFQPSLIDSDKDGIHKLLHRSISKLDKKLQERMYSNIVLAGGTTLIPKFETRLKSEIEKLEPSAKVKVITEPRRKDFAWIGGSLLCPLPDFQKMWITREKYYEVGSSVVKH